MHLKQISACAAIVTAAAGAASGQTISQAVNYDWDYQGEETFLTIAQFDDMGGTRELTGVRLSVDGTYSFSFVFHNADSNALPAFAYDPSPTVGANLNPLNASLFLGPIAQDTQKLESVDLTANDGVADSGPDQQFYAVDGTLIGTVDIGAGSFGEFVGNGSLLFEYSSFPLVNLPKGWFAGINFDTHVHSGVFTVEYDYVTVPAPMSAGLLGVGVLALTRRRR
ncbi:MAG: hypothetical protein DHS20C14_15470 [Phycisphaeraceae bacterium]|nr:MAG: hypothetical protein DHS20C14_15470 [Phycisphaeraceae bacterium]